MGVCNSQTERNFTIAHSPPIDTVPPDTAFLKSTNLPVLAFYVLISDLKLKKCPYDLISIRFSLERIDGFSTPLQPPDRQSRVYWKVAHAFDFYVTQYELRNMFLLVQAVTEKQIIVGSLKMNMFTLWVGPYHQDFKLETIKQKNCRISFNLKMSQGIHIKLTNQYTEIIPNQEAIPGDRFSYSIEAIIGQQLQEITCPYIVRIKSDREEKGGINEVIVDKGNIHWKEQQGRPEKLPKFDKKIAYYEIYSSSLHLIFFKLIENISSCQYEMVCQCFISLRKLMTLDYLQHKDTQTNITFLQRKVQLEEKAWFHGKQIGKVKLRFKFEMQAHLKQMQTGVRTEQGILASSPVFSQGNNSHTCQEIIALGKLNNQVQQEFIKMTECQQHYNLITLKQNALRINSILTKQLALLQRSSKQSILIYQYKDQIDLYKSQRFLIDFAFKALTYIREDKPDICQVCWSILTTILKRGEFNLNYIGFSKDDKQLLNNGKKSDSLKIKIDVALKYQELLNHLLNQTLALLFCKGDETQQQFAQSFCAYAYFRIPAFRQLILTAITRQNDPQIPQWRGTQVNLYESDQQTQEKGQDFYQLYFDWENNFYKPISNEQLYKFHNTELSNILSEVRWMERLKKRSGAFYTFIQNLVSQIQYVSVVSKYIKWHHLPGYSRLLHAFLVQLKDKRICDYTDRIKRACIKLLSNERLLNIFVVILLKKTNINDPAAVETTLSMINSFMITLKENIRPIPSTFDYIFFLEGLKMVLNSDLEYSISQALLLIYHNIYNFSQEFGLQLCLYLLSSSFFKFFFHWSQNLRHIFHVLIFIRISRYSQLKLASTHQKHNIQSVYTMSLKLILKERMDILMDIIKKQLEPLTNSNYQNLLSQKNLYKKMKYKLTNKKIEKQKNIKPQTVENILLPDLRIIKSSTSGQMLSPSKLLYFKEEEMEMHTPKGELKYVRQALNEYASMAETLGKNLEKNPNFVPQIKLKRIIDESQATTTAVEEW